MAYLNDYILDAALFKLDNEANRIDICTQQPTTYAEATSTFTKGNKVTGFSIGGAADRTPDGRKVTVGAFSDGSVTGNGTVTHWAIVDTVNSRLLAAGALSASQAVTSGNTFSLPAFDIGIPDAV